MTPPTPSSRPARRPRRRTARAVSRVRGMLPSVLPCAATAPAARRSAVAEVGASPRVRFRERHGGRVYDVHVPAGRHRGPLPVLVLLHGCAQTADEFLDSTGFAEIADRDGVLLVVPHQELRHHARRCWRWYEAAHQGRGAGEPGLIAGIVEQVLAEPERWTADPARVYAAGISAGGAMALVLAATYPDVFAAVGAHSAPPYRAATRIVDALLAMAGRNGAPRPEAGDRMAPVVCVQGTADRVVRPANGDHVAEQWLAYHVASEAAGGRGPVRALPSHRVRGRSGDGTRYTVRRWYTRRGRTALEYWSVDGLGHAWSGGRPDGSFADPRGPRAATLMWRFFRRHRLDTAAAVRRPVA